MITHRERIENCLAGKKNDRVPVALWRHFPVDDQNPYTLAAATTIFQKQYEFDFIKVTPASSYCIKDWGATDEWRGNTEGTREYGKRVIQHPEEWTKLRLLEPKAKFLGNQITCLELLTKEFSPNTPIIQTIFNPLSQAKNLVGRDQLLVHMRQNPEAFHAGLEIITQSTIRYVEELKKLSIDGIFFAVQHGQNTLLSPTEFDEFCKPYDLRIMETANDFWLNLIHLHGNDVMFEKILDYNPTILNWHDRQTPPTLAEARKLHNGVFCGGLRQWDTMAVGTPEQVNAEARDALETTEGEKFILGTGCVLPIVTPHSNIVAAIESVTN